MLHQTSMTLMVLMVILLGAYAAEYRIEQSEMPIQAKSIVSSFRTKLEETEVIKNDIQVTSHKTNGSRFGRTRATNCEGKCFISRHTRIEE